MATTNEKLTTLEMKLLEAIPIECPHHITGRGIRSTIEEATTKRIKEIIPVTAPLSQLFSNLTRWNVNNIPNVNKIRVFDLRVGLQ